MGGYEGHMGERIGELIGELIGRNEKGRVDRERESGGRARTKKADARKRKT